MKHGEKKGPSARGSESLGVENERTGKYLSRSQHDPFLERERFAGPGKPFKRGRLRP